MSLLVVGISHKTLGVEQREKASLSERAAGMLLSDLTASAAISGAVALSTCNRTEIYASGADADAMEEMAAGALVGHTRIGAAELAAARYVHRDERAAMQLFRVASSLDSMIIGESEIQGQVRRAWDVATSEGATDTLTNELFRRALGVGKRVRSATRIGAGSLSISAVAVDLVRETVGDLARRRVLVIGAGRVAESAVSSLARWGTGEVVVANRTPAAARDLARRVGGRWVGFDGLAPALAGADIVVSSTDAPHVVLTPGDARVAMELRAGRPMVVVDISVPRDVDSRVGDVPGITLFQIDDLERVADANLNGRRVEAERSEQLVAEATERFAAWYRAREVTGAITALRARAEDLRRAELERHRNRWESASEADLARLDRITAGILAKLLHEPTVRMRLEAEAGTGTCLSKAVRHLFGLDEPCGPRAGDVE